MSIQNHVLPVLISILRTFTKCAVGSVFFVVIVLY